MKRFIKRHSIPVFILILILNACVVQRSPVTGDKRAYGFSWEKGKQMGAQYAKQVKAQYGIYQNQRIQKYVENVADNILAHSDLRGPNTPAKIRNSTIHYQVLDNPVANAFTLPGGYIYVDRGLLTHLENEAQLAMIIGHETGHAAARHSAQQAFNQKLGKLALLGGAIAGQKLLGISGDQILSLGSQAEKFLFLKYSRDDEREADRLGVEYSSKAGYKAKEAVGFFQTLQRENKQNGRSSVPEWQQTHPDPGERIQNIDREAQKWQHKGYKETTVNTDKYMHEIDNMIYGENPRHGFTRNGMFYHPDMKFKFPYPKSWTLINTNSMVEITNSNQNAIIAFEIDSKNNTPQASVNEFLNQQGVKAGQTNIASYNGLNGYEARATGQTQNGTKVKFYLYSVKYNGHIYRFICYTPTGKFDQFSSVFKRTADGFNKLTDQSILNIQPARLHVFRANRTAPFKSFLPKNLPLSIKPKDVASANQVSLDETIQKGTWLKVPR